VGWNDQIIEEFRNNGGQVGGAFADRMVLLMTTTGAKSGMARIAPLVYVADGDRYLIAASKGGADTHPDWLHNLKANPGVSVEVGAKKVDADAEIFESGPERDRLYAKLATRYSFFTEYESKTERIIPVVALQPTA